MLWPNRSCSLFFCTCFPLVMFSPILARFYLIFAIKILWWEFGFGFVIWISVEFRDLLMHYCGASWFVISRLVYIWILRFAISWRELDLWFAFYKSVNLRVLWFRVWCIARFCDLRFCGGSSTSMFDFDFNFDNLVFCNLSLWFWFCLWYCCYSAVSAIEFVFLSWYWKLWDMYM